MEKEFIPYEQALGLKELGFDNEVCYGWWTYRYDSTEGYLDTHNKRPIRQIKDDLNQQCLAPLYQQAFRWFREKYDLDSFVKSLYKSTKKVGYYYSIDQYKGVEFQFDGWYESYEEAELECLKKLIEVVKQ
jgi:hypothetical protein